MIKDLLGNKEEQQELVDMTDKFVDDFAQEGLRTLFLGKRIIS